MVRRHAEIEGQLRWRTGAVFCKQQGSRAVVRADYEERRVHICVTGHLKALFLAEIRTTLSEIHDSFQKNKIIEEVACPCPDCRVDETHYHQLHTVIHHYLQGMEQVLCPGYGRPVPTREILIAVLGDETVLLESTLAQLREDMANPSQDHTEARATAINNLTANTNLGTALISIISKFLGGP